MKRNLTIGKVKSSRLNTDDGPTTETYSTSVSKGRRLRVIVFNATFNDISAISWRSVLLMEVIGESGENLRPAASQRKIVSHNVVASTLRHERGSNSQLQWW